MKNDIEDDNGETLNVHKGMSPKLFENWKKNAMENKRLTISCGSGKKATKSGKRKRKMTEMKNKSSNSNDFVSPASSLIIHSRKRSRISKEDEKNIKSVSLERKLNGKGTTISKYESEDKNNDIMIGQTFGEESLKKRSSSGEEEISEEKEDLGILVNKFVKRRQSARLRQLMKFIGHKSNDGLPFMFIGINKEENESTELNSKRKGKQKIVLSSSSDNEEDENIVSDKNIEPKASENEKDKEAEIAREIEHNDVMIDQTSETEEEEKLIRSYDESASFQSQKKQLKKQKKTKNWLQEKDK